MSQSSAAGPAGWSGGGCWPLATPASGTAPPALLWVMETVLLRDHIFARWHFPRRLPRGAVQHGLVMEHVSSHRATAFAGAQPALLGDLAVVTHWSPGPEHPHYSSAGTWLRRALCFAADEPGEVTEVSLGADEEQQGAGIALAMNLVGDLIDPRSDQCTRSKQV